MGASGFANLTEEVHDSTIKEKELITEELRDKIFRQIFHILCSNKFLRSEKTKLETAAKNIEANIFSREHKSQTGYETAFLKLRSLLKKLEFYKYLSLESEQKSFDYDYLKNLTSADEKLLKEIDIEIEKKLIIPKPEGYNPLSTNLALILKKSEKESHILGMQHGSKQNSNANFLDEVYEEIEKTDHRRQTKLSTLLRGHISYSPPINIPKQKRSSEKKERKRKSDKSKKKKSKKDKKKKDKKKKKDRVVAKFSSESESEPFQSEGDAEPFDPFMEATLNEIKNIDDKQSQHKEEDKEPRKTRVRTEGLPPIGSILKINYPRGNFRIFESEDQKQKNEGVKAGCLLFTTCDSIAVTSFPEMSKPPKFVFNKFPRDVSDLENNYLSRLSEINRAGIHSSKWMILSGWVIPDEPKKLESLRRYLVDNRKALGCSVSPAMSLYITHGSLLTEETLKHVGIKVDYSMAQSVVIEPQRYFVFFLKKKEDKNGGSIRSLTFSIVQNFDKVKEVLLKYRFSQPLMPYQPLELSSDSNPKNDFTKSEQVHEPERNSNDDLQELLEIFKKCDPETIRNITNKLNDVELKKKLRHIIQLYFPHLSAYVLTDENLQSHPQSSQPIINNYNPQIVQPYGMMPMQYDPLNPYATYQPQIGQLGMYQGYPSQQIGQNPMMMQMQGTGFFYSQAQQQKQEDRQINK